MASDNQSHTRQLLEIQQAYAQISRVEQMIADLELECQMNEMTIGNVSVINDEVRIKIETAQSILHTLRVDLTARESMYLRSC